MSRGLYIVAAVVELGAGLLFLIVPSFAVGLIGGSSSRVGVLVARVFGAAACTLGGLCWAAAGKRGSNLARALSFAMLGYNAVVTLLLLDAQRASGVGVLSILVVVHGVLAVGFGAVVVARR